METLKDYTARATELEAAIYTQKKLMAAHKTIIEEQRPLKPMKREIEEPKKPQTPAPSAYNANYTFYFAIGLMLIAGILGVYYFISIDNIVAKLLTFILIGIGIGGCACVYSEASEKKQQDEWARIRNENYQKELAEYPKQLEEYKRTVASAEEAHRVAMEKYEKNVLEYDDNSKSLLSQHTDALTSLETALQLLYDENIIFPKYRNMVAITTINEYLMSGRCFELEGPNGAYNLYEMELRQNIIIGQLAAVIDNLEQIRNNQFSLYRELVRTNDTVNQIVYEIRDLKKTTKLTAYFAGVAAKIAASPKIIKGIIH